MTEGYGIRKVGPNRYREDPGRYFEDFNVGDVYEHWPGRTVTESDNIWFTNLTMNTHPVHFDANYASQTEFGKYLVNSAFTLALVTGMCVSGTSQKAIANLGWEGIKLPAPVFVGELFSILCVIVRAFALFLSPCSDCIQSTRLVPAPALPCP